MTAAPAAPPPRLVPLAAGVLAAHFLLLQQLQLAPLQRAGDSPARSFRTRTVAMPERPPPTQTPQSTALALPGPRAEPAVPAARPRRIRREAPLAALAEAQAPPATRSADAERAAESASLPASAAAMATPAAEAAPGPTAPAADTTADGAPQAFSLMPPARLRYEVVLEARGLTLNGQAELQWRHDGSQYEARLEVSAPLVPTRVQSSQGRITAQGLAPGYFADRSRGEQATHFDRDQGRVIFSNNRPQALLAAGMQDRLSVVLQLAALVAGRPQHYGAGTQIVVPTASTREAENWVFTVEGEVDLALPGGAMRALKLQRMPRKEFDVKVELWLAPRMDYAPVRLRLTNPNGDTVDQRWTSTDKG